jgi:hypothetical protein
VYISTQAETIHLKFRRYSRELTVKIGYRRFWKHQTMYEIFDWLTQDLLLDVSKRQVLNLIGDFLALLRAAQPPKIRQRLKPLQSLIIGMDGMQPEKGNKCLYIVREIQTDTTLMAESLAESSNTVIGARIFDPLKALADELGLRWQGVVSDAQESIRLAVAHSLQDVPHQACQSHCLRDAGKLTFEADRSMKTQLKAAFRQPIERFQKRIRAWPESDGCRAVLIDYAAAVHTNLLEGGVAPFELGGVRVFEALDELAASLARCQKKEITSFYAAY